MYPHTILGRKQDALGEPAVKLGKKSKKGKGKKAASASDVPEQAHTAAVMGLSWNRMATNLLASSSADHTVKLWDLNELKCVHDYRHHKDKVAAVQFHPTEASVLLTAAYDQRAVVLDARSPSDLLKWRLDSDVECVKWVCINVVVNHAFISPYTGSY